MSAPSRPVLRRHGQRTFRETGDVSAFNLSRFVVDEAGCHVWSGALSSGYAIVGTNRRGNFRAARLVYVRDRGPIPPGMQIDHLCRNRACINSAHLELVTNAENTRRGAKAKLTADDVREIRRRVAAGGCTYRQLAREFGVRSPTISNIANGKRWKEVK